ncbi:MAG: hypothetical protein CMP77_01915 [Flavobacterium sp.]|nr:hypothetical protein [Flavobacterium sp.]
MPGILAAERNEVKLVSPQGINAGGTAYFKLPTGLRYHMLVIKYAGDLTDYPELRVVANTETIRRVSFTEQDMMNQTDELPAAGGLLVVPFDSLGMRIREGQEETALNVGRPAGADPQPDEITTAEVQIDIDAGASAPALEVFATTSAAMLGGAGLVRHVVKTPRQVGGAGEFDIQDLPFNKPNRALIRRAFFATESVNKLEVYRDNVKIFERTRDLNTRRLGMGARNQQSGWTLIDKTEDGYSGSRISTVGVQDFRFRLNMTGAEANMPVITEYLGTLKA